MNTNWENNWRSLVLEGLIRVWINEANADVLGDRSEIERSIARQVLAMYGAYDIHAERMKSMRSLSNDEREWIQALVSMAEAIEYNHQWHIAMAMVLMGEAITHRLTGQKRMSRFLILYKGCMDNEDRASTWGTRAYDADHAVFNFWKSRNGYSDLIDILEVNEVSDD